MTLFRLATGDHYNNTTRDNTVTSSSQVTPTNHTLHTTHYLSEQNLINLPITTDIQEPYSKSKMPHRAPIAQMTPDRTSDSVDPPQNLNSARAFGTGMDENSDAAPEYTSSTQASGSLLSDGERTLSKEEADRLYEERMEEEYAKREGGA
ncbi:hypothetical protein BO71DRAFT_401583 [Aspergillus ellipticus CBS 707.79]|uniref:Uncharacterized protein n=1 Tax=Aspergillus ellipticus CBS 707.79 TaxID=1448320 RepID=A0A319DJ29_9EURO|nr:hypothetical protein BO71DRAFT_401583 [Aspergillus ellipticus CBS 707.79]